MKCKHLIPAPVFATACQVFVRSLQQAVSAPPLVVSHSLHAIANTQFGKYQLPESGEKWYEDL
jgi:hypothetical protein